MNKSLLSEIAFALTCNDTDFGAENYFDLTDNTILCVSMEYMIEDITPEELGQYQDWEKEIIKAYQEHDLIKIDPISSHQSFEIMEDFANSCPADKQKILIDALCKKHPFAHFRATVEQIGLIKQWYDYKNLAEEELARQWLEEHELNI